MLSLVSSWALILGPGWPFWPYPLPETGLLPLRKLKTSLDCQLRHSNSLRRASLLLICSCALILYAFSINCCFNPKIVNGPDKLRWCVVIVGIHYPVLTYTTWWGNSRTQVRRASIVGAGKLSWPLNIQTHFLIVLAHFNSPEAFSHLWVTREIR